jgi:hypothetical protein
MKGSSYLNRATSTQLARYKSKLSRCCIEQIVSSKCVFQHYSLLNGRETCAFYGNAEILVTLRLPGGTVSDGLCSYTGIDSHTHRRNAFIGLVSSAMKYCSCKRIYVDGKDRQ